MSWDHHLDEEWADVPGQVGRMWVSSHGRAFARGRIVRPGMNGKYVAVGGRTLHITVAEAFRGPRPAGHLACHYDDDKSNNHLGNVYWGTPADNARDRVRNEHARDQRDQGLTTAQVAEIRADLRAATARRAAADVEAKAAREDLHELAMRAHEARLLPAKEILAAARIKETWFYKLVKLRDTNRKAS